MKKTIKSLFALVLTVILAFSGVSAAFAAENETIITSYGRDFGYAGKLKLGKTDIRVNNDELLYYTFNAENDGYYLITYPEAIDGNEVAVARSLEKLYGAYEEVDGSNTGLNSRLFRFDAGIRNICIIFADEYEEKNAEIEIEYLGSEIVDFSFPIGTDYPLINNSDLIMIVSYEYFLNIGKFSVVFDSGKTLETESDYVYGEFGSSPKKGENAVDVTWEDVTISKTLTVAEATDYIEKVELMNDSLDVVKYYSGHYEENADAQYRITYKDGTQITAKIDDEIDLKTGNPEKYTLVMRYSDYGVLDSDELYGTVRLAGYDFEVYEVNLVNASPSENIKYFFDTVSGSFNYISHIGERAAAVFEQDSVADSLREFGAFVTYVNNNFIYAVSDIFKELSMLVPSLLGGAVIM